jgi:hypothetical protein
MRTSYTQFLTALRNAQHFLSENDAALGTINQSGARAALDQVTTTIASLAAAQGSHQMNFGGSHSTELRLARILRRRYLAPVVRIARAKLPDVPKFANLSLPPSSGNTTALATFTESLLATADPYTAVFVSAGLPADFAARARTASEQMLAAGSGKGAHRTNRVKATDAIDKQVREARRVVAMLDSLVVAQLDEEDPILRAWREARRIIQGGSVPAAAAVPAASAPVPPAVNSNQATEAPAPKTA